MSREEDIQLILDLLHKTRPTYVLEKMREQDTGSLGVLKFLFSRETPVKSKEISDQLEISSARTAVLLKKLETKGLIQKSASPEDARVTLVQLSTQGFTFTQTTHNKLCQTVENLIDEFGTDYLIRLLQDMAKLKAIMESNHTMPKETIHD